VPAGHGSCRPDLVPAGPEVVPGGHTLRKGPAGTTGISRDPQGTMKRKRTSGRQGGRMPVWEFLLRVALSPVLLLANLARDLWAMARQALRR